MHSSSFQFKARCEGLGLDVTTNSAQDVPTQSETVHLTLPAQQVRLLDLPPEIVRTPARSSVRPSLGSSGGNPSPSTSLGRAFMAVRGIFSSSGAREPQSQPLAGAEGQQSNKRPRASSPTDV